MSELDYVVAVDGNGGNIYASEYFTNPDDFTVEGEAVVAASGTQTDPFDYIVAKDENGGNVYASEYFTNPTEFVIGLAANAAKMYAQKNPNKPGVIKAKGAINNFKSNRPRLFNRK